MEPEKSALITARHILQYLQNEPDDTARQALETWLAMDEKNRALFERLRSEVYLRGAEEFFESVHVEEGWERLAAKRKEARPSRSLFLFRRLAAAAVIGLLLCGAAWYWLRPTERTSIATQPATGQEILPGGNKAILTLSGGRQIILDSVHPGALAQQGGAQISKTDSGQLAYKTENENPSEVLYNTLSTPRGGQYQVVLPDGTKVWLNAASSITYPTTFAGTQRKVMVTGEAYLEVAKDPARPFTVGVNGLTIAVLGTSFNLNSYADEKGIKTTLVEGSVSVIRGTAAVILKPGQQANLEPGATGISVLNNPDIEQALAWKNGLFNFTNADLSTVMRQLERWYDINVQFEGVVPAIQITGEMKRGVKLSTVLNWFADLGIKTRLEGKTLIVL